MQYAHEGYERKQTQTVLNNVWPELSSNGSDHDAMRYYLATRRLSAEVAEANVWYPTRKANDDFLRICIPCVTPVEGHVYWQARAVSPKAFIRYQSPKASRLDAVVRVQPLNEHGDRYDAATCVVVEGPMDALAAAACGYDSFALMGITPPQSTVEYLSSLINRRRTIVLLDNECEAAAKGVDIALYLASKGILVRQASPPRKDLAELTPERRLTLLRSIR